MSGSSRPGPGIPCCRRSAPDRSFPDPARNAVFRSWLSPEVAPAEVFLQPHIETDEQVAAPHLLDLELRLACPAVAPRNGHRGPRIVPHDHLERDFDSEVEVRRKKRS